MSQYVDVPKFFDTVYLIDLSPSLLKVAKQRFERLGWQNVKIICEDVRNIRIGGRKAHENKISGENENEVITEKADLITLSYSLTMIPDFFPVIDLLPTLLSPTGVIAVVDFYVQNLVDIGDRNYTGDVTNRHVNYVSRVFWRAWFDVDRVNLEPARRDYLEYKFGTISCANLRNYYLGIIPYYIWLGCPKQLPTDQTSNKIEEANIERIKAISTNITSNGKWSPADQITQRDDLLRTAILNLEAGLPLPSALYQVGNWILDRRNSSNAEP